MPPFRGPVAYHKPPFSQSSKKTPGYTPSHQPEPNAHQSTHLSAVPGLFPGDGLVHETRAQPHNQFGQHYDARVPHYSPQAVSGWPGATPQTGGAQTHYQTLSYPGEPTVTAPGTFYSPHNTPELAQKGAAVHMPLPSNVTATPSRSSFLNTASPAPEHAGTSHVDVPRPNAPSAAPVHTTRQAVGQAPPNASSSNSRGQPLALNANSAANEVQAHAHPQTYNGAASVGGVTHSVQAMNTNLAGTASAANAPVVHNDMRTESQHTVPGQVPAVITANEAQHESEANKHGLSHAASSFLTKLGEAKDAWDASPQHRAVAELDEEDEEAKKWLEDPSAGTDLKSLVSAFSDFVDKIKDHREAKHEGKLEKFYGSEYETKRIKQALLGKPENKDKWPNLRKRKAMEDKAKLGR